MARTHATLPQVAEVMFCDTTYSIDRFNITLFILSTSHPGGDGYRLAALVTSDEKLPTSSALQMLKDVLPTNAFYGNGVQKGPQVIMTDYSAMGKVNQYTLIEQSTLY